ncbi:multidrug efflux SMR transporter [Desulfovibrio sp. OttesenSCG-928-G15]|nr:multidrug efflux SMR transporter [Desulfovibrio sp. OttesenSCG-928-G15]
MNWVLLFFAIFCEAAATAALKLAEGFTRPIPSTGVLVAYGLSLYFFSLAIRTIPIGIAYAVWSGIGVVFILLIGLVCFGQKLDIAAIAGIGAILAGLLIIHLFSKSLNM